MKTIQTHNHSIGYNNPLRDHSRVNAEGTTNGVLSQMLK